MSVSACARASVCMCACVRACVCVYVHACRNACVRVCVHTRECVIHPGVSVSECECRCVYGCDFQRLLFYCSVCC